MNKMLLAGSTGIVLLSAAASPVWADDNASTFSDTPSPILITPERCVGYGWQTTMKCHRTGG